MSSCSSLEFPNGAEPTDHRGKHSAMLPLRLFYPPCVMLHTSSLGSLNQPPDEVPGLEPMSWSALGHPLEDRHLHHLPLPKGVKGSDVHSDTSHDRVSLWGKTGFPEAKGVSLSPSALVQQ